MSDRMPCRAARDRIPCRAVFLDAGGVLVLPDRHLLASALGRIGIVIDPDAVPRAHYRAVRALDGTAHGPDPVSSGPDPTTLGADRVPTGASDRTPTRPDYPRALFPQLGIVPGRAAEALAVWERLAERRRTGDVLWREPTPGAREAIDALRDAGATVVIVTNSDGHAEENLAASGFAGLPVIDSTIVGAAKPDRRIFDGALTRAGVTPAEVVHVGDSLTSDIAGAQASGITPIHFDPLRACRRRDHRHVRSLAGLRRHIDVDTRLT